MIARSLSLAGQRVDLSLEGEVDEAHLDARFSAFYGDDDAPALGPPIALSLRATAGWAPEAAPRAAYPGVDLARDGDALVFTRETERVRYEPERSRVEVEARPTARGLPPLVDPTPVDTPLRLLMAYLLPRRDGVLLHASGYADARGAVCFLAVSGGGKTTTARKLPEASVLSDDQVALRRIDGAWEAFSLPFVGEWARATRRLRAPLRGLVLLAKGEDSSFARVRGPVALAGLARSVVNFVTDDPASARILDHAASLMAEVPAWRWTTPRDGAVEPVLDAVLG